MPPTPTEVKALIEKFEHTLNMWPKDGGLFLDLMKEKLKQIESNFTQEVLTQLPEKAFQTHLNPDDASADKKDRDVYVALYQMQGDNLDRWKTILHAIGMQGVSRPIYENEADVINLIRHKEHPNKEGYAVVKIPNDMILHPKAPPLDKNGKPLVHVKPNALKIANVIRFVHKSGQYALENGHLVKLDLPSPLAST